MPDRGDDLPAGADPPVLDLQRRWVEALIAADIAALDTILVDTYVDTDESGSRTDKAGILAALKSGDLRLETIDLLEDACSPIRRFGGPDWRFRASRFIPGSTDRAKDTFYGHLGSGGWDVEGRRGTPNDRAGLIKEDGDGASSDRRLPVWANPLRDHRGPTVPSMRAIVGIASG
jgi:hypothetical protein